MNPNHSCSGGEYPGVYREFEILDSAECNVQRSFYRRHSLSVRRQQEELFGGNLQQMTWLVMLQWMAAVHERGQSINPIADSAGQPCMEYISRRSKKINV